MRYDFVETHRQRWPIRTMCRVLLVSASGYYGWRGRPKSATTERREALVVAIKTVHGELVARGKAYCWDNAPMESFFASLKKKWTHGERFATREQAKASLFEYIEVIFYRVRRHSSLGYKSPAEHEMAA